MYLILIALTLLLIWLLLDSFAKSNPKRISNFLKNARWYALSAFLLLLGVWLLFTGKAYLSWVGLFAFMPLVRRLLMGVFYMLIGNFMRRKLLSFGAPATEKRTSITLADAEKVLDISRDSEEAEIIEAYLNAKKDIKELRKSAPDKFEVKLNKITVARDKLLLHKNS